MSTRQRRKPRWFDGPAWQALLEIEAEQAGMNPWVNKTTAEILADVHAAFRLLKPDGDTSLTPIAPE